MDLENLPPQVRSVLSLLAGALRSREPALRAHIEKLRHENPTCDNDQLAAKLVASTRKRVAASGAMSGAMAIAPGLGTILSLGASTSQALYALEQQTELVLAIAMLYGHELTDSDDRVIEALVVVGIAGGAVKLRENVLIAGGQKVAVEAFRHMPAQWIGHAGGQLLMRVLGRAAAHRVGAAAARALPLAVGMALGAGWDWFSVTGLGKAAIAYYGPGGPAARVAVTTAGPVSAVPARRRSPRRPRALSAPKDLPDIKGGD